MEVSSARPPKISVALATFNGARFLQGQLESLLNQEVLPDEVVVGDDRSTDDTPRIVREFVHMAPFPVHFHVNERQLGTVLNFAATCSRCSSDVIALCDQDDIWLPARLSRAVAAFARSPELGGFFSDSELVNDEGVPLGQGFWDHIGLSWRARAMVLSGQPEAVALRRPFVQGATLTFRRSLLDVALPFPTELPEFIHDRWLGVMIVATSRLGATGERLVHYRQHRGQQIGAGEQRGKQKSLVARFSTHEELIADDLQALLVIRERLESRPCTATPRFRKLLESRIAHLRARAAMPASRFRRIPIVGEEWLAGRYDDHASGVLSAIKDLIR